VNQTHGGATWPLWLSPPEWHRAGAVGFGSRCSWVLQHRENSGISFLLTKSSGGRRWAACDVRAAWLGEDLGEVGAPLVQAWDGEASRGACGAS
jgi:hypothetical protein